MSKGILKVTVYPFELLRLKVVSVNPHVYLLPIIVLIIAYLLKEGSGFFPMGDLSPFTCIRHVSCQIFFIPPVVIGVLTQNKLILTFKKQYNPYQSSKPFQKWNKLQKRNYWRLKHGFRKHKKEKWVKHLVLTSNPYQKRSISEGFTILKGRMERLTILKLCQGGYFKESLPVVCRKYYNQMGVGEKFGRFAYHRLKTLEGVDGVLHIVCFMKFIPQSWIEENWHNIMNVPEDKRAVVNIHGYKMPSNSQGRHDLTCYVINQVMEYVINQYKGSKVVLVGGSTSWLWVCRGFVYVNLCLFKWYGKKESVKIWNKLLDVGLSCFPEGFLKMDINGVMCFPDHPLKQSNLKGEVATIREIQKPFYIKRKKYSCSNQTLMLKYGH